MTDTFVIVSQAYKAKDTAYFIYHTQQEFDWVTGKTHIVPQSIVEREFESRTNSKYVSKKPQSVVDLTNELNSYPYYPDEDCRSVGAVKSFHNIMDYSNYILDKQCNIIDTALVIQV